MIATASTTPRKKLQAQGVVVPTGQPITAPYYQSGNITLYHGPFQDVLIPHGSINTILTDPPYPKAFLHVWRDLAVCAASWLEHGGSLLALAPHYALPEVFHVVGQHLKYRWLMCMWQGSSSHARMGMGLEVLWKPLAWWVKGNWPKGRGFVKDGFISQARRKEHHVWEQGLEWAQHGLRVVRDDGLILDPLLGSGTAMLACQAADRPAIGIDADEACVAQTAERLYQQAHAGGS